MNPSRWDGLALDMTRHTAVTLTGAGGKTSLLYALAREAADAGRRVIVTTTTHILKPATLPTAETLTDLRALLKIHKIVVFGVPQGDKLCGAGHIAACKTLGTVLIEGDGAHGRPLKAPAAHEPVVPPESDAVVAVAGLTALGGCIADVCHRPERVCEILGKPPDARITPADIAALLASTGGGRKGVTAAMDYRCVLNQADSPGAGAETAQLLASQGIHVFINSFEGKERGGLCSS